METPTELCPRSAVSHGVGLAGLVSLGLWIVIARHYGMDGPNAGLAAVVICGAAMVLWSVVVDKVHRRPDTGLDWHRPKAIAEIFEISSLKLLGLWATWALIALCFMAASWYWADPYRRVMNLYIECLPWLVGLSIPYVLWVDRHMVDPHDSLYGFGQWLVGGAAGTPPAGAVANHLRAWAVKGFFLTFMLSIVPGNFANLIHWTASDIMADPVRLGNFLITLMFEIDVAFATAGYMLTCRPLDAHIRSANPYMDGWVAALICYPPLILMNAGGPLFYENDTRDWAYWLAGQTGLLWLWAAALVLLTAIYAWATVAFGLRFSNLTHRGIITQGPYRLTRHPAYISKNTFWWLSTLPFLVTSGSVTTALRNTVVLALVSGIYYWRAKTEEEHLSIDPAYRAYAQWIDRHGLFARIGRIWPVRHMRALLTPTPAE